MVGFRSLTESIDTGTAHGRLLFGLFGTLAEFERELTKERVAAGREAAKRAGRKLGRKRKLDGGQIAAVRRGLAEGISPQEVARSFKISRSTLYATLVLQDQQTANQASIPAKRGRGRPKRAVLTEEAAAWPTRTPNRLREKAESSYEHLEQAFLDVLPGSRRNRVHRASDDGDRRLQRRKDGVRLDEEEKKPSSGWQTVMVYLPELEGGLTATFGFECRYEEHFRQLAILIDGHRPGERLPEKMERKRRLTSLDFRVMSFSEMEILADPAECRERVEGVLFDMVDELLVDSGQIRGKQD
jgi:hypothetical protein